jgi:hypothetical protein
VFFFAFAWSHTALKMVAQSKKKWLLRKVFNVIISRKNNVTWRFINVHTVASDYISVPFVRNLSKGSNIRARTMGSVLIPVMCAISHFVWSVLWWYFNAYIMKDVHIPLMFVRNRSSFWVIWRDTRLYKGSFHILTVQVISSVGSDVE